MLDTERSFFDSIQKDLLEVCPGRFVVIKGRQVAGNYQTMNDALSEGAKHFGLTPFLVRRVDMQTETVSVPALTLGMLSANPSHTVGSTG